jgi:hypothetical protein
MLLPALASFPPFAGSSSSKIDLHRGNGIPRPRDKPPKIAFRPETVSAETETQPQEPAICGVPGLFGKSRGSKECVVGLVGFELRTRPL